MAAPFIAPRPSVWNTNRVLMLPLAGYVMFVSKGLVVDLNPTWASLLLLWTAGATILTWWLTRDGPAASRTLDRLDRHSTPVVIGVILATVFILGSVNVLQVRYFALSNYAEDSAYYNQLLWNTLHGNVLSANLQQERLFNPPVSNELALHVSPVLLVVVLPIYTLFPNFLTLLMIRDVALAAAAWPLFLLARERLGGTGGVAAAILYLANPAVIAQGIQAFSLVLLAPLPFFLTLRAFMDRNLGRYMLWMLLALAVREDVAIAMAGFGLWALVTRRPVKWWALGLGVPAMWWIVTTLVVQPGFGRSGNNVFEIASTGGQSGLLGLNQMFLGNPAWILEALREGGVYYLYRLLRTVGFVGILGWEGLLALPGAAANLILGRVFYGGIDPLSRFAVLPSCALVGAAVAIASRVGKNLRCDIRALTLIVFVLLPSASLLDGAKDAVLEGLVGSAVRNDSAALWEAVGQIPDSASLAAPTYALPAVSKRARLFTIQYLHMYPPAEVDYMLFDRNLDRVVVNAELRRRYVALLETVSQSPEYQTVWQRDEYFLVRRTGRTP